MSCGRTTRLIAGLLLRQFLNRMRFGLRKKKPAQRSGTARKRVGSVIFLIFLAVILSFQGLNFSVALLRGLTNALGPERDARGRIEIPATAYRRLQQLEAQTSDPPAQRADESFLTFYHADEGMDRDGKTLRARALVEHYRSRGLAGFSSSNREADLFFPKLHAWQRADRRPALLKAVGAVLLLFAVTRLLVTLSTANQDLGKVESRTEWLFTFPAASSHLFFAQILGHALVDPFSWFAALPFLFTLFYSANFGWWSPALALGCMFYLGLIMASLRVVAETWLRKRLPPAQLKNLQALFSVAGICMLFFVLLLARGGDAVVWLVSQAQAGPMALVWNPLALPAGFCVTTPAPLIGLLLVCAAVTVLAATACCGRLVRNGLVTASGAYAGYRTASPALPQRRRFLPAGIIGKDIQLLLRDRNFLVQTLIAPVLVVAFQLLSGNLTHSISTNFQAAATFAYGLGAYVLIATALSVLAVEGNSLWMLYALPVELHRILLRKTLLWACCALTYTTVALTVCALRMPVFHFADLVYAATACAGVFIYAFIAAGIGILGTDPLEAEVRRRVGPSSIYLYMLLAALFGYALHAPSTWSRLGQMVLSALLAYALWQKVRDRSPFLLDPVAAPPPRISLADGLIAALAFFVLQGVTLAICLAFKMTLAPAVVIAFSVAGALVVTFTLLSYWRTPRVFVANPAVDRKSPVISLGIGVLTGLLAGGFGLAYLTAVQRLPALQQLAKHSAALQPLQGWKLVFLAVVAAPLFEEFIFRGLVFRGMRRSLPLALSIFGSAAIFALCHPPISVIPVFLMASLAAWSFEYSGRLLTPIAVHVIYNSCVLFLAQS